MAARFQAADGPQHTESGGNRWWPPESPFAKLRLCHSAVYWNKWIVKCGGRYPVAHRCRCASVEPVDHSKTGSATETAPTTANTVMQTSSVASENCSFISALYPTGWLSCQTGVWARHPGALGLRSLPKMSHYPAGFSAEALLKTPPRRRGQAHFYSADFVKMSQSPGGVFCRATHDPIRATGCLWSDAIVDAFRPARFADFSDRHGRAMRGRFWAASFNLRGRHDTLNLDGNVFHTPRIENGRSWRSR